MRCTRSALPVAAVRFWLPLLSLDISVVVLLYGLYIAAWVAIGFIGVMSVHRRALRLLVGVLAFAVPAWGIPQLRHIPGYSGLWPVTVHLPTGATPVPLGPDIVAAAMALGAFWLAGWLLDRRVEL
jgi:hypothetical protein